MIKQENKYTNLSGLFPNALMIDASGAGLTDGSEFAALPLNDGFEPLQQAIMDYAAGSQNSPTGSVGVPNGVADAAGVNQFLQAIQKAHGIGPGNFVLWGQEDDPSVTGDRVILLSEQGVLIATYPALDDANWIGGNTAAQVAAISSGLKFYRSSDAAGLVGDAAGPYLQLPPNNQNFRKQYLGDGTDFTVTGTTWVTTTAWAVPFQSSDGEWFMFIHVAGTNTSALARVITVSGFSAVFEAGQALTALNPSLGTGVASAKSTVGNGAIRLEYEISTPDMGCQGIIKLPAKPTWADDFEYKWGIRY